MPRRLPSPLQTRLPMLILFDHVTPRGIARFLSGHTVTRARERGWDRLTNGDLLAEAERAGFEVFLTADKNIRYQQNLAGRKIAVVVLSTPQWPALRLHVKRIAAAVDAATPAAMSRFRFRSSRDAAAANPFPSSRQSAYAATVRETG
jgi:hypothetical protein